MPIAPGLQKSIQEKINSKIPSASKLEFIPVGGGCINECYHISSSNLNFFCKVNSATKFPQLFIKESEGLETIRQKSIIKVPAVIDLFEVETQQVLLLEWIKNGEKTENFWKLFGEQLAALHHCSNELFGFADDNYMGSVVQLNTACDSWSEFFIKYRLQPLISQCQKKVLLPLDVVMLFEKLFTRIHSIFDDNEKPALVHGDLWSGNFMCNQNSEPVLIDPAVGYGHRSVDLGMSNLFGGFRSQFYESYNYHYPLPQNYQEQWKVSNLYPLLIHLMLFGKSYLPQIESTLKEFS